MATYFLDMTREQLSTRVLYLTFRLATVIKEKSDLTFRVDVAEVRAARVEREKKKQDKVIEEYGEHNQKMAQSYNDLVKRHNVTVEEFRGMKGEIMADLKALRTERDELLLEKESLARKLQRSENCLAKTRVAFTELKKKNEEKRAEIDSFVDNCNDLEKRLADAWSAAQRFATDLGNVRAQYEHLKNYFAMTQPVTYPY